MAFAFVMSMIGLTVVLVVVAACVRIRVDRLSAAKRMAIQQKHYEYLRLMHAEHEAFPDRSPEWYNHERCGECEELRIRAKEIYDQTTRELESLLGPVPDNRSVMVNEYGVRFDSPCICAYQRDGLTYDSRGYLVHVPCNRYIYHVDPEPLIRFDLPPASKPSDVCEQCGKPYPTIKGTAGEPVVCTCTENHDFKLRRRL